MTWLFSVLSLFCFTFSCQFVLLKCYQFKFNFSFVCFAGPAGTQEEVQYSEIQISNNRQVGDVSLRNSIISSSVSRADVIMCLLANMLCLFSPVPGNWMQIAPAAHKGSGVHRSSANQKAGGSIPECVCASALFAWHEHFAEILLFPRKIKL